MSMEKRGKHKESNKRPNDECECCAYVFCDGEPDFYCDLCSQDKLCADCVGDHDCEDEE